MTGACARVHGAISLVSAIAAGKGATMGISLEVVARVETSRGDGILLEQGGGSPSERLIRGTVQRIVPGDELDRTGLRISLESQIPAGYGLKSSSATSSAVALACAHIFRPEISDEEILLAGVEASIEAGVSITGAYDDACACYFGGFIVTDNRARRLVRRQEAPGDVEAVIFIPDSARRKNPRRLAEYAGVFEAAWQMAADSDYWNAMILNGIAAGPPLGSDPALVSRLLKAGALGASVSGNGTAVAAAVRSDTVPRVKEVFESMDGRVITSPANNRRAEVDEV